VDPLEFLARVLVRVCAGTGGRDRYVPRRRRTATRRRSGRQMARLLTMPRESANTTTRSSMAGE